ncbi:MAG: NAD(+)--rifampin ADP-ribosyltransferase [Spirosomataceae bacterium]
MEFNPTNTIVKLCLQGMGRDDQGKPEEARSLFLQAWNEATNDLEKFLSAYYVARHQADVSAKIKWLETALQFALKINNEAVSSVYPSLYSMIAECYKNVNDSAQAEKYREAANSLPREPSDTGPFYHGTKADLQIGDFLNPGHQSNYQREIIMNHIYFTALANGAGLAAALAQGEGRQRVYIVEPTGSFENDPNVTDKKFPGNLTRSYRTQAPLKIVGEVTDWEKQTPESLQEWREKLTKNKGEIIN